MENKRRKNNLPLNHHLFAALGPTQNFLLIYIYFSSTVLVISWEDHLIKTSGLASASNCSWLKRSFPLDVMAAILVDKNNPLGIIFYFMQINSFVS